MKIGKNCTVFVDVWPLSWDCWANGAPSRVYIRTARRCVTVRLGLPYRGTSREWEREKFSVVVRNIPLH